MRAIHYINQFFGQIGGEDKADYPMEIRKGVVGPGLALQEALNGKVEIIATIVCGDNYFNENLEDASAKIKDILNEYEPDLVIAGPAFNAGRYGLACGTVLKMAYELHIPAVSGMFPENPGVETSHKYGFIIPTGNSAADMRKAVPAMSKLIGKIAAGDDIFDPEEDGYIPRGQRVTYWTEHTGAKRAVNMLLDKLAGRPFDTELPLPTYKRVKASAGIKDLSKAKIAVLTSGGIVPKGNPDHIEAYLATKFKKYSLDQMGGKDKLDAEVCHGGYDPIYCNEDPNRMLPVDALREFEKEGVIGKLYDFTFVTAGNGMIIQNAVNFGQAIAKDLVAEGVDGVLLTSA